MLFQMKIKNIILLVMVRILASQCFILNYHRLLRNFAKISMIFPEKIIDKIFEYEYYNCMKEYLLMYKFIF